MEGQKPSWDRSRVRLRTAHELWIKQRDIFVKATRTKTHFDEAFAHHLLQQHAALCTERSCASPRELGIGSVPQPLAQQQLEQQVSQPPRPQGQPQAQMIKDPPRLTPIKFRGAPADPSQGAVASAPSAVPHQSTVQEVPAGPSTHFDPAITSTPKEVPASLEAPAGETVPSGAAASSSPTSRSRRTLFASAPLLDHPYFREPLLESDSEDSWSDEGDHPEYSECAAAVQQQGLDPAEATPEVVLDDHFLDGLDVNVFDLDLGAEEDVEDDFTGEEDTSEDYEKEAREHINTAKCIAYVDRLMELLRSVHGDRCKKCKSTLHYRSVQKGTALLVMWECKNHHGSSWSSQPRYHGMFSGNLHVASSIIASGNSFQKIAAMAKFTNLFFFSRTHFANIQKLYIAPAINEFYGKKQDELFERYTGLDVVLSGDGRADSPGYSASMMTYSFCDEEQKQILHSTTVMVQEAGGKSPNMERIGFERGLDFVRSKVNVTGIVTDAHPQIAALMKKSNKYDQIRHQWDIWHGCKNLMKKINNASQQKGCEELQPWLPKISNHFWYSTKKCERDSAKLAGNLNGLLHHIVNEHEWPFTTDDRPGKCDHEELDEERETAWLKPGSLPHQKLYDILHDKRFMKTLSYYTDFRHTGCLEAFHSTLLMYATKRSYFSLVGYVARVKLAILDTNYHSSRPQARTKEGKLKWRRKYNKRTKKHVVVPVPEAKSYGYMPDLLTAVYAKRAVTPGHISQHISLSEDDPRRIHPTIAMKPAEPTEVLVAKQKSRFSKE